MPLPSELTLVTVHGKYTKPDGTPETGSVVFIPTVPALQVPAANTMVPLTHVAKTLDTNGEFTTQLLATNDPDATPTGWTWAVAERLSTLQRDRTIEVPYTTVGTLELADVADATPAPAIVTYALASALTAETAARAAADALLIPLTQKAAADGVATLDGTTRIPTAQVPNLDATKITTGVLANARIPHIGLIPNTLEAAGTYWPTPSNGNTTSAALQNDRAYATSVTVERTCALTEFGIQFAAGATGGNMRAALYAADPTTGLPGALITDYGQQPAPSGAAFVWWTPSTPDTLTAGLRYYLVVIPQAVTGAYTVRQRNTCHPELAFGTSRPATMNNPRTAYYSDTGFTGAAPNPYGAVADSIIGPLLVLKLT